MAPKPLGLAYFKDRCGIQNQASFLYGSLGVHLLDGGVPSFCKQKTQIHRGAQARVISHGTQPTQNKQGTPNGVPCLLGGGRGIRTHAPVKANGFQDFLTNPTLTKNNRRYQTVENAENPDVARVFGVLSFPNSKT